MAEAEALILLPGTTHGYVSKMLTGGLPGGPEGVQNGVRFLVHPYACEIGRGDRFFPLTSGAGVLMGMIVFAGARWI